MMYGLRSKRWSPIAVDVGTASLHAVQVRANGSGPVVHEQAVIEQRLVAGAPEEPDWTARFGQLKHLIDRHDFKGRRVALALDPPLVELRPITLPAALLEGDRREVIEAIRWELGRVLSFPEAEAEFDFWPLPATRAGAKGGSNVMAVAADGRVLRQLAAACQEVGFCCTRIDAGPCALVAGCRDAVAPGETDIWGILDLGAEANKLCVAVHETPVYQRVVPGAGLEIAERMSQVLGVDLAAAEDLKRQFGIQSTTRGYRGGTCDLRKFRKDDVPAILFSILRPVLEAMQREIERAFAYVMQAYPDGVPKCLVTIGQGAKLEGLRDWLGTSLGVPIPAPDQVTVAATSPRDGANRVPTHPVGTGRVDDVGMVRAFGVALLALEQS